ncbi:hypothetical protein OROGR_016367 [Orobanche gracilis]
MAEVEASKLSSLAEEIKHYLVEEKEHKPQAAPEYIEDVKLSSAEEVVQKIEETPAADVSEIAPPASEENGADEESKELSSADETTDNTDQSPSDEINDSTESEELDNQEAEDTPEIKLVTAPADFRFPTTNQTRHCFTRYIEYHRCVAAKGEGAPECDKFAKYYRSLCPGEWIDRWNEQRENGTFPGPL